MSSSPRRTVRTPGSLPVGSLLGVPVRVSATTAILVAVLTLALVPRLREESPGLGPGVYLVGVGIGVLVYGAVLVHELAHAVLARRYGHDVDSITLSLVGGRTAVAGEAASPREEFATAVVGPLASLVLGAAALGLRVLLGDGALSVALEVIVLANLILGLLDLVPAPPMDGGRLVKAVAWRVTGSPRRGAVVSAYGGRIVAVGVLLLTLLVMPRIQEESTITDTVLGVAVALLLWTMATHELTVSRLRLQVGGVVVRDLARRTLTVPLDMPLAEAIRRAGEAEAPGLVTADSRGTIVGVVPDAAVAQVPEERRPWIPTSQVARPVEERHRLPADITGDELLSAINRAPVAEYLLVEPGGVLVGVLALTDLDRAVRGR
jgi:Zn-dependent protease